MALLNEGVPVEYGTREEICLKYNISRKYRVQPTDGSRYSLEETGQNASQIAQWLENGQIETIHSCEPTLETVFLEVTGRELA